LHTKDARYVIELPIGAIQRSQVSPGDQIAYETADSAA
jgi:uncharacterized membrane protein (UPF0127 family)